MTKESSANLMPSMTCACFIQSYGITAGEFIGNLCRLYCPMLRCSLFPKPGRTKLATNWAALKRGYLPVFHTFMLFAISGKVGDCFTAHLQVQECPGSTVCCGLKISSAECRQLTQLSSERTIKLNAPVRSAPRKIDRSKALEVSGWRANCS